MAVGLAQPTDVNERRGSEAPARLTPPAPDGRPGAPAEAADGAGGRLPEAFFPTEQDIRNEIALVLNKRLSPTLSHWSEGYGRVGHRNHYLWKWARQGIEVTTLSCVDPQWWDDVCDTKVLGVILDVLLDDVADRNGDDGLLERLLRLPEADARAGLDALPEDQRDYARFTFRVWDEIHARARRYPNYARYAGLLAYDYQQVLNTMRYSHLLNRDLALLNLTEHDLYLPHNMHMMVSSTLDLMCSPAFDHSEVGRLREAVWHGQCMGRIGNLVTTWERELGEGDYTSAVYARAVALGDVTPDQLRGGDREAIRAAVHAGQHEAHFLQRWQDHRLFLLARRRQLRSVDLGALVSGLQRLICLHLGSRGSK